MTLFEVLFLHMLEMGGGLYTIIVEKLFDVLRLLLLLLFGQCYLLGHCSLDGWVYSGSGGLVSVFVGQVSDFDRDAWDNTTEQFDKQNVF